MHLVNSLLISLENAPKWVFFLLGYSVYIGIKGTVKRKVTLPEAIINLIVLLFAICLFVLSFLNKAEYFYIVIIAIVFSNIPYFNRMYGISVKIENQDLFLAGSSRKLLLLVFLFVNRYMFVASIAQGAEYMDNMLVVYAFHVTFAFAIGVLLFESRLVAWECLKCRMHL